MKKDVDGIKTACKKKRVMKTNKPTQTQKELNAIHASVLRENARNEKRDALATTRAGQTPARIATRWKIAQDAINGVIRIDARIAA